ncbi:MAG: hypothetical protein EPO40_22705 [Myxococcaceae bacterium]|nr:MAG: hypothetical protein EPO40_22705 [Myxococcaceae bacterium]
MRLPWITLPIGLLVACAPEELTQSAGDAGVNRVDARVDARVTDRPVVRDTGVVPPRDTGTVSRDVGVVPPLDTGPSTGPRENCATPFDDDNDGVANEDCACTPGMEQMCFERPEDAFRGMCRMGRQRCEGTGEFGNWSACGGSWLPIAEAMNRCEVTQDLMGMTATRAPVDILLFVDTSGSMTEETAAVNANMNRLAMIMGASGLDYRVIMVARRGTARLQVCIPSPLGGAACGDSERLRHINVSVDSVNGLRQWIATQPMWLSFTRPGSLKFFVAITDDESSLSADAFHSTVITWPGFSSYVFHSIVGYESRTDCPTLARRGGVYLTLTSRTRGLAARVCSTDWTEIFTSFARDITSRANAWTIDGDARPDTVQVWIVAADGTRTQLTTGWTYDAASRRITIDPASLPAAGSRVEVLFRTRSSSP